MNKSSNQLYEGVIKNGAIYYTGGANLRSNLHLKPDIYILDGLEFIFTIESNNEAIRGFYYANPILSFRKIR